MDRGRISRKAAVLVMASSALFGLAGGSGIAIAAAHPTVAASVTCFADNNRYNSEVSDSSGARRGIAVGLNGVGGNETGGQETDCTHVASTFVGDQNTTYFVEAGWLQSQYQQVCGYSPSQLNPMFFIYVVAAGTSYCTGQQYLSPSTYESIRIESPSANYCWSVYLNGNYINCYTTPFQYGWGSTNGERHASTDSAWAWFEHLSTLTGSGWYDWSSSTPLSSTSDDPVYQNCIYNYDNVGVKTAC